MMRVIGAERFGGPEVLDIHQVPEPHAGPGMVRIAVRTIAVSPTDTLFRAGRQGDVGHPAPYIPGMDAAGVIDEVGPDIDGWSLGDRVMAIALPKGEHGGAYVEKLIAPIGSFARIPDTVDFPEAATVPMNALTAAQAIRLGALPAGGVLAVTGGAGLLGGYLVQLGVANGLTVVADAAEKDADLLRRFGAEVVARGPRLAERIRERYPDGVDAVVDTALLADDIVPVLRDGGVFVAVRSAHELHDDRVRGTVAAVMDDYLAGETLAKLADAVAAGTLTPRVAEVLPVDRASEVHRRVEAGGVRGRFVLAW